MVCWIYTSCWHRGVSVTVLLKRLPLVLSITPCTWFPGHSQSKSKKSAPCLSANTLPYSVCWGGGLFLSTSDRRIEKKHRARGCGCFYFASKTVFRTSAAFLKTGCKCESCEHVVCFPVLQKHIKSFLQVWAGRDFLNCNWGNWNLVHAMAFAVGQGFWAWTSQRHISPLLCCLKRSTRFLVYCLEIQTELMRATPAQWYPSVKHPIWGRITVKRQEFF